MKKLFVLFSGLSLIIAFNTCTKEKDGPTTTENVIIAKGVNVISSQVWNKQIISVDPSNYTVRFSNDINSVQQIKVGDIIISDVGEGLLRKVKNINTINNELVVETEFASLSEAIQQGTIDATISLTDSQIKGIAYHADGVKLLNDLTKGSAQTTYNWNINTVLYDADGNRSTTTDQIKLEGNFSCDLQIPLFIDYGVLKGLKEVKFGIESSENLDLRLVTGLEYGFEKEVNLATVYFTPITIMVGIIPVIFTPELDVIAGIGGSANASITTEINQSLTFDAGIRYLKGQGWSPYKTFSKDLGYQLPHLNLNTNAEVYIKPELSLRVYGIAGPYANLKLYGRLDANILQNPWWKLYGGITMAAGAKVSILDLFTLDFVISDLINYEQVLAQATAPPVIKPLAAFTGSPTTVTAGQSVQFTDQSTNTPTSWSWTFGDGGTSTIKNPSHVYASVGTFTVTLTATNNGGSNMVTKNGYITVNTVVNTPVAAFTGSPTTITAGQSVQFTDQSTNTPTSWSWNFGDGGTSTTRNPSHIYSSAGTYTVTLTAINNAGSDGETKNGYITVNPAGNAPVAAFTGSPTNITAGQSVQFTDQSTNTPTSWSWNFGDGGTSTARNPSHIYSSAGTYTVTLTAINNAGSDGETKNGYITVNPVVIAPIAAFTASNTTPNVGQSVQFTDQSTNNPTSWSWNFGDGGTSTARNPTHTYSTAGTYTVTLTATNSSGSDGETKNGYITVYLSVTTVSDIDGNVYKTIQIGTQTWMAENLKTTKYNDNTTIPPVADPTLWAGLYTPGYCWYDNDAATYKATYGALYNWYAVNAASNGSKNVCPTGWHIPTDVEWGILRASLGGTDFAGGKLKEAGYSHWLSPNTGADNESGFTALPGGNRSYNGVFMNFGTDGHWWSSSEYDTYDAWSVYMVHNYSFFGRFRGPKNYAFSIRCLKN